MRRQTIIRAQAPVRLSLGGGGTDVPEAARLIGGGRTLTVAVALYTVCLLRIDGGPLRIHSVGVGEAILNREVDLALAGKGPVGLLGACISAISGPLQASLTVRTRVRPESGLGGSSSVAVATLAALAAVGPTAPEERVDPRWAGDKAFDIERNRLGMFVGKLDPFAVAYGGVNIFDFSPTGDVSVQPLNLNADIARQLEDQLTIFETPTSGQSGTIMAAGAAGSSDVRKLRFLRDQADRAVDIVAASRLDGLSELFNESWEMKTNFGRDVDMRLAKWRQGLMSRGALGVRLSGAGYRGSLIAFGPSGVREALGSYAREEGLRIHHVTIASNGVSRSFFPDSDVIAG